MNLVKRAVLYTIRQKQKSILLFLVLVLVSTLFLTGISIQTAVKETTENLHRDIASKITLERNLPELDHEAMLEAFEEGGMEATNKLFIEQMTGGDFLTFDILESIMEIPGVSDYNLTAEVQLKDAQPENYDSLNDTKINIVNDNGQAQATRVAGIQSATNSEMMAGFVNGNLKLDSGRHLRSDDHGKVMISNDLAEYNNLNVGDIIRISGTPILLGDVGVNTTLELEIIGTFSGTRALEEDELTAPAQHVTDPLVLDADTLIIDMSSLLDEYEKSNYFGTGAAGSLPGPLNIFIENPNEFERVHDEISNLSGIYGKNISIVKGTDGFEDVLGSLGSLHALVRTLILIIVFISIGILAIILSIWTRGRINEIGIYLANGIKKQNILSQFILEATMIAIIAFAFSMPISQAVSKGAGQFIMTQFTASQELRNEQLDGSSAMNELQGGIVIAMPETGFMDTANIENTLEMVDVVVHGRNLMWVYTIGLSVIMSSVIIASYSIVKLKPKEILTKMS